MRAFKVIFLCLCICEVLYHLADKYFRTTMNNTSDPSEYDHSSSWVKQTRISNKASNWCVLWVQSDVEVDISHLTEMPGWNTVVVGDGLKPHGCRYPKCVFLNPESQAAVGSNLNTHLPRDHLSRKNLAYLYAIKQGAQFIYDASVHVKPLNNLTDFFYTNTSGLLYIGSPTFNYYQHFGEHWFNSPGGATSNKPSGYVLVDIAQPEVQVGLIKVKDGSGPRFQSVAPPVFIGSQSFATFSSDNILFSRKSFWGLFTLPGSKGSLLRSCVLQALLKHVNGFVGFLPPNAVEDKTFSDKVPDIPANVTSYISKWKCLNTRTIGTCFNQLISNLLDRNVFTKNEYKLMKTWLWDLRQFSYRGLEKTVSSPITFRHTQTTAGLHSSVVLSPSPSVYYHYNPVSHMYDHASKMCPGFTYPNDVNTDFSDILLIVTFNYPQLYQNVLYVQAIYGKYFPNILYCGNNFDIFKNMILPLLGNSTVMFVTGIQKGWYYFQDCMVYAMKMNLNVKGYLQIGDDTLVNPWTLKSLPRNQIWHRQLGRSTSRNTTSLRDWVWWGLPFGKMALNKTFNNILMATRNGDSMEKSFYNQYVENVGNFWKIYNAAYDFFYIPHHLKDKFIYFTKKFFNSSLMIEAAMPAVILGITDKKQVSYVISTSLWLEDRNTPEKAFNATKHYFHPFKAIANMKLESSRRFICKTFLPYLVENMP